MAKYQNPFKKQNPDPSQDQKSNHAKSKVYFGVARKQLPTRTSFKERKNQIGKQNFVPKPGIETILKRLGYKFSFENVAGFFESIKTGKILLDIKYWLVVAIKRLRDMFFDSKTQFALISIFILGLVGYTLYLTAFSTEFLVKNYRISFTPGSYLDKTSTQKLVHDFTQKNILGYIPDNHFWFLNSQSLTAIAKSNNPNISQVQVTGRYWPASADLEITTEPILATIAINSEYYIISQSGYVIGRDYGGHRQKVVNVQSPHKNVDNEELSKVFSEQRPGSQVGNNQLNRLFFIKEALPKIKDINLNIIRTEIRTLFEKDTDVFFITDNESKIILDGLSIALSDNLNRLDTLLDTTQIGPDLNEGKIDYIDLRVRDRIFVCYRGRECQTTR
jgi:hypothetical protein